MKITRNLYPYAAGLAVAALLLGSTGVALAQQQQTGDEDGVVASSIETSRSGVQHARVCAVPKRGDDLAGCNARIVVDPSGAPKANVLPAGNGPAQLRGVYGLASVNSTQTIAIVDAYNDPYIKSDLDKYDSTFGLPFFPSCSGSVTTSCFQKVNQKGGTSYPQTNAGWALEIALDVEVAHGLCPTCKILLVEASSNGFADLMAAEDRAAIMGAKVISNSWGANEFSAETTSTYDGHLNKSGVAITFSSGDSGYGVEYPAASQYVTAVGGTTLTLGPGNTYGSETTWAGAGSGCSAYEPQTPAQALLGLSASCPNRMVADVSADADPASGAAVYDSVRLSGRSGWFQVGGTSLAAPIVAATYAQAGNASSISPANGYPYSHTSGLHDVTSGSNGSCTVAFLCIAGPSYDGPTGMGSPKGISAF
jgi:hypothetical protein